MISPTSLHPQKSPGTAIHLQVYAFQLSDPLRPSCIAINKSSIKPIETSDLETNK